MSVNSSEALTYGMYPEVFRGMAIDRHQVEADTEVRNLMDSYVNAADYAGRTCVPPAMIASQRSLDNTDHARIRAARGDVVVE